LVIAHVQPEIDGGYFPIKRIIGEKVKVTADIFADGHDQISAALLFRKQGKEKWQLSPMSFLGNDRWSGEFTVEEIGTYEYTIEGWVDHLITWLKDIQKRFQAQEKIKVDILSGVPLLERLTQQITSKEGKYIRQLITGLKEEEHPEKLMATLQDKLLAVIIEENPLKNHKTRYPKELKVIVDRKKALFSAWYELFPRSCSPEINQHGTFLDCEKILPDIANLGFDILYFPPIHPIGKTHRKGKNNAITTQRGDPGSPWAIGDETGGHMAIHPQLGSLNDLHRLIKKAKEYGIEIALDLAFQCSRDHPYIKTHPEWFRWRADGTIQYAENPPKKYEDIVPFDFETDHWQELWQELKKITLYWIEQGIKIFRVDNPHTKPFLFWEWLIGQVKEKYPEVIFLSESFTRPKVMYHLAKIGFTQSYTYYTWRNTKYELTEYLNELTNTPIKEYFRPNFWPNTPDILSEYLQLGDRPAFFIRFILAATLSSNYGIYGPPYERFTNQAVSGKEEYLNSEKYEIKQWENKDIKESTHDFISRINQIRRENPALQMTNNLKFYHVDNDNLLYFGKVSEDLSDIILIVVNLDPHYTQSGWIQVPLSAMGIEPDQPFLAQDLLGGGQYIWQGEYNYVELNPNILPAHILKIKKKLKKETDFDYFI
jgi:starch synthase (maltosyl-transferring)